MIGNYSFGRVEIAGKTYTSDVLVFPDGVRDHWWRREGHLLQREDLAEVFAWRPEVLVVGTGAYGCMKVAGEVEQAAREAGVELVVADTATACRRFNELAPQRRVVAALHLTC